MTLSNKEALAKKNSRRYFWRRLLTGAASLRDSSRSRKSLFLLLFLWACLYCLWPILIGSGDLDPLAPFLVGYGRLMLFGLTVLTVTMALALIGTPPGYVTVQEGLQRAGFVNHIGEAPVLIARRADKDNPKLSLWEFDPCGIPLTEWEDKREVIETALNITVVRITWGHSRSEILLTSVAASGSLPAVIPWSEAYLPPGPSELALGDSCTGRVTVDLAKLPHVLLGGSTGSGKSAMLKLLLKQALYKDADVYIADFKGGVDFPPYWHEKCHMCFEEEGLLTVLSELVNELERRKQLFLEAGYSNIDDYNEYSPHELRRCIFACDEVAEVFDKTGRDKEGKALLSQIEAKIATIARLGRAFGIHLILATQRPDATIIPGQIKNNLDCRICGRADSVLSQIILDSTAAADQIPKDTCGRFLLHDGTLIQGYYFEDTLR